ncbi:MAG: hypothetical protein AB7O96_12665 [Pseudobdellovibrionaceae bacterium]
MLQILLPLIGALLLISACQSTAPRKAASADATKDPRMEGLDPEQVQKLHDLFKGVMTSRHGSTTSPKKYLGSEKVQRAVFLKTQGCARGTFEVAENLDSSLSVGLFESASKRPAYMRISSDTTPDTPDQKNGTVGISIKVLDVPGKKVLLGEEDNMTQDFLLQNHPVFFVNNFADFLFLFTDPVQISQQPNGTELLAHYQKILDVDMVKEVKDVLATSYWSTTPYKFGENLIAKYKVVPCSMGSKTPSQEPNYLATSLKKDLEKKGACFEFQVQTRPNDLTGQALLEKATEPWDEKTFKPHTVGRLHFPAQNIDIHAQKCEDMAFTVWHSLPAHQPLGSINKGRGLIYKILSDYRRHERNGYPILEPTN